MSYMGRNIDVRADPSALMPGARSVVSVAMSYQRPPEASIGVGQVASYAHGYDYHKVIEHKLDSLGAFIRMEAGVEARTRSAVDRLPLLERDVAYLCGVGWIGKNTMLINRQLGSYLFLGELVIDLDLEPAAEVVGDFCGSCTACLDACPTDAFEGPYVLNARRCISYLTIELRGPIPRTLRPLIGQHLFGCDICQAVCPWNRKSPHTRHFAFLGRPEVEALTADTLLREYDEKTFRKRLALTAVQRAGRAGLLRNAAVVLGNTGDLRWVGLLTQRLEEEADPLVRGHIAWALGQLSGPDARLALEKRFEAEDDAYVKEELAQALKECS
jgi:epoxyqueuosine reductase